MFLCFEFIDLGFLIAISILASKVFDYFVVLWLILIMVFDSCYRMYSELISKSISEGGPFASKTSYVKLLR